MSNLQRIQMDAEGNEVADKTIEVEIAAPSKFTQGAKVVDVNLMNKRSRDVLQAIHDPHKMDRISAQHEANADEFELLDLTIENLIDAGRPVPASMREQRTQLRIQLTMSSAQLAAAAGDE